MIVQEFLKWSEVANATDRANATSTLARAYLCSKMDPQQRQDAEAAMTVLMDDAAPKVRLALADALGASNRAPRHIILGLARDLPEIAMLVACRSPLFLDYELVEMINNAPKIVQIAIACRQPLPKLVCAAVCKIGTREACEALLQNNHVVLNHDMLLAVADRFGSIPNTRSVLMEYPDLPVDIAQILLQKLATGLTSHVVDMGWLGAEKAQRIQRESVEKATIVMASQLEPHRLPRLVEHLRQSSQLTAAVLLRAICKGDINFFKAALASLTGLPQSRIHAIIANGRSGNFRAAYTKSKLPSMALGLFETALDAWREAYFDNSIPMEDLPKRVMDQIVARYNSGNGHRNEAVTVMLNRLAAEVNFEAARNHVDKMKAAA